MGRNISSPRTTAETGFARRMLISLSFRVNRELAVPVPPAVDARRLPDDMLWLEQQGEDLGERLDTGTAGDSENSHSRQRAYLQNEV